MSSADATYGDRSQAWVATRSGRRVYPFNPQPEQFCIEDIAHALAGIQRYGGHVIYPYTVAEHSVIVSSVVPQEDALWGLLHDAAEAYIGDMVTPIKRFMPEFCQVEDGIVAAIAQRFGLRGSTVPDCVHEADRRIVLDERRQLLVDRGPWPHDGELEPLGVRVGAWSFRHAKERFLDRFHYLNEVACGRAA